MASFPYYNDITVTRIDDREHDAIRMRMSRKIGGQLYRQEFYIGNHHSIIDPYHDRIDDLVQMQVNNFWHTTSAEMFENGTFTTSALVDNSSNATFTNYDIVPEFNTTITWSTDSIWSTRFISWPDRTHYEKMQEKINEAWELYCRNENHSKNMQDKIQHEWWAHCENEKIAEAERIRLLPEKKANELMGLLIGKDELEVYRETGRVFVKGKNGLYMVKRGGGVSKIEGKNIIDFCVHIERKHGCPPTDHAIALKMMLEENDMNVIKIANRIGIRQVDQLPIAACM